MQTIVLDPGHGGSDPGTCAGGLVEKDYQLAIALRLRDALLARYDGLRVVMTRETDADLGLQARCDLANAQGDRAVFISLHHDAAGNARARGGSIYVYGPQSWVPAVRLDGKTQHQAPWSFSLARTMLPEFEKTLAKHGIPCRGIYAGNFHVLRETEVPAVLFEAFFATSPEDVAAAATDAFQADLVDGYCQALGAALGLEAKALPAVRVVLPDGREISGELRGGSAWMPVPGTEIWAPARALAEAMGRQVVWQPSPPTVTIR